jgi:hypothetical protein
VIARKSVSLRLSLADLLPDEVSDLMMEISHHLKGGETLICLQARIPDNAAENRQQGILATIEVKLHFL